MSSLAIELFNILSGRPFCHDRHGGQQRILERVSRQIDYGAFSTTVTSERQKQLVGFILGGIVRGHFFDHRPIGEVMKEELERCAQTEAERDFINQVKRAFLALGNFRQGLSETQLKQVLGAVVTTGKVDPLILKSLRERTGDLVALKVLDTLAKSAKTGAIQIEVPAAEFPPSQDKTPLSEPPKESPLDVSKKIVKPEGWAAILTIIPGFTWLYAICNRIRRKKKGGEKVTFWDRAQQVAAGGLVLVGAAAAFDAGTKSRGALAIAGVYARHRLKDFGTG